MRRIRGHMVELRNAPDLRDVALGCLALMQASATELHPAPTDERVPAAIRSKGPRWITIEPGLSSVTIEFGAGFFHYGYRFEPVTTGAGVWCLLLYGEEPDDLEELLRL